MDRLLGKCCHIIRVIRKRANDVLPHFSPGRFHASIVMKLVIAQIIMRYDIKLEDEKARTLWSWETFVMPYESTQMILRKRVSAL
jgi:hypothetical protein